MKKTNSYNLYIIYFNRRNIMSSSNRQKTIISKKIDILDQFRNIFAKERLKIPKITRFSKV